jgi:hypothetical protein
MSMLAEHLTAETHGRLRNSVRGKLIKDLRNDIIALGAGPAIPQFNQNTKQRKPKTE